MRLCIILIEFQLLWSDRPHCISSRERKPLVRQKEHDFKCPALSIYRSSKLILIILSTHLLATLIHFYLQAKEKKNTQHFNIYFRTVIALESIRLAMLTAIRFSRASFSNSLRLIRCKSKKIDSVNSRCVGDLFDFRLWFKFKSCKLRKKK